VFGGWADDSYANVPIGFTFSFYGAPQTNIWIASNGFATFSPSYAYQYWNEPIPNTWGPNGALYVFWDDLTAQTGPEITYRTTGTAPNRQFFATWNNVSHYYPVSGGITMQIVLYEGTNRIEYCYGNQNYYYDFSGTIGMEDYSGTVGTQIAYSSYGNNFPASGTRYSMQQSGGAPGLTYAWDLDGDGAYDDATGVSASMTITPNPGSTCEQQKRRIQAGLRVVDCASGYDDTDVVDIQNGDFVPPVIVPNYDVNVTPAYLYIWPANHDCVTWDIPMLGAATDNCDSAREISYAIEGDGCEGCLSSQAVLENGTGSGHFTPDCCVNDGPCGSDPSRNTFKIREERNGNQEPYGEDRAYFVDANAIDSCGNASGITNLGVCVFHDMSNAKGDTCSILAGGYLEPACPGPDNKPQKPCARP